MRKSKVPTYTLSSLDLALDYPGSVGALYVEMWRGVLIPKQIVLTTPSGKYHFIAVTGTKRTHDEQLERLTELSPKAGALLAAKMDADPLHSLEVSELLTREEAYAYARFILHIPDEPVWLALVG